jgi:hypothetical protein
VVAARVAVAEEAAARAAAAMAEVAMDVVKGTAAVGRARRKILQVEVDQTTHRPSEPRCGRGVSVAGAGRYCGCVSGGIRGFSWAVHLVMSLGIHCWYCSRFGGVRKQMRNWLAERLGPAYRICLRLRTVLEDRTVTNRITKLRLGS